MPIYKPSFNTAIRYISHYYNNIILLNSYSYRSRIPIYYSLFICYFVKNRVQQQLYYYILVFYRIKSKIVFFLRSQ